MTDQAGTATATETGTGTAIIIYVYKMQAGSKGKRRQGQQMGGRGCGDSQRQVSVHWQLCTSSSSSSINVQPVAPRPISRCWAYCAPNRAEPNRTELNSRAIVINCATEFGSNFAGKLRVAMRRQIRFGCSTQATVQPGPQVVEGGGVVSGRCRLLQLQLPRLELAPRLISNFDLEQIM